MLRRPSILLGESPSGYFSRLAGENGLAFRDLKNLGLIFHSEILQAFQCLPDRKNDPALCAYVERLQNSIENEPALWNRRHSRFCPACLSEKVHWRVHWELIFSDACPTHGCWLVDRCDRCGSNVSWQRQHLEYCDCGQRLASQSLANAPIEVLDLVNDLNDKFDGALGSYKLQVIHGLDFSQTIRLVRFLGTYGDLGSQRKPQKLRDLGAMNISWPVTSIAAQVLSNWPHHFHRMLHAILTRHSAEGGNRFPARFGFFYAAIFRRFSEPGFAFMRNSFEDFIAEHWRGPLARRNTRLSEAILKRASWIPANHARVRLGVSRSRLNELVKRGRLVGEERLSDKGRRFLVVNRSSLESLLPTVSDQVDLVEACDLLGLTKSRLRSAIEILFPGARKVEGDTNHWAISRTSIEAFLRRCSAPMAESVGTDQVCLDQIMRYWACSEAEIAAFLVSLRDGSIAPVARLPGSTGLRSLIFGKQGARVEVMRHRQKGRDEWTVPQVAQMLAVKQEVAYYLVRTGLIASEEKLVGRRMAAMISRTAISAFQARYVFVRDLARRRKTSPRALQAGLAEIGIQPVTSNMTPPCRQSIYEWSPELQLMFPKALE